MTSESDVLIRIVDDNEAHGVALCFMLKTEGWQAVNYVSGEAFLKEDDPERPGCVVLDYQMPGINGVELQELMLRRGYTQPILFLTAHADVDMAITNFKKGADDLLKKPVNPEAFLTAIATAVEKDRKQRKTAAPDAALAAKYESLTQRERQVVELVLMGLLNCQVAQRLNLSERTVETHRANVYRKLGVSNLNELRRLYGMMR